MARETKEQKEIKRGELEMAAIARREEYLKGLPARILEAQVVASGLPVTVTVSLGPTFRFYHDDSPYIDSTITLTTDEWEMRALEEALEELKLKVEAKEARRLLAVDIISKLDNGAQLALLENIHLLQNRFR